MRRSLSIQFKILVAVLCIPIVMLAVMSLALYRSQFQSMYEQKQDQLLTQGLFISEVLADPVVEQYQVLRAVQSDREVKLALRAMPETALDASAMRLGVPNYELVSTRLADLKEGRPIDTLYIASLGSKGLIANTDEVGLPDWYDARQRPWFTGALESHKASIEAESSVLPSSSGAMADKTGQAAMLSRALDNHFFITAPYVNADTNAERSLAISVGGAITDGSTVLGVAAVDFDIGPIIKLIDEMPQFARARVSLFATKSLEIIYSEQTGMYDPDKPITLSDLGKGLGYEAGALEALLERIRTLPITYFEGNSQYGVSMIQSLHIPGTGWGILVGRPLAEVSAEVLSSVLPPILLFAGIFLALQLLGVVFISRSVFKPMRLLTASIDDLAQGEGDLTATVRVVSRDELGKISQGFNSFTQKLRSIVVSIKEATHAISIEKSELISNTEQSASAAVEISANIDSVNSQISVLNTQIQAVSDSMEEIQGSVLSLNANTDTQRRAVDQASSSIEEMVASLNSVASIVQNKRDAADELTRVIEDAGTKVDEAARAYNEVVELASRINDMSKVIQDIASQTNLLSMNAAIEAAHAGDSGRGFAVVAAEIRKLAELSQSNSAQITSVVKDITDKIDLAASVANNSRNAFEKLKNETRSTIHALEEINSSTRELTDGGRQIIEANSALSQVSESVMQSAKEIQGIVSRVSGSTTQIAAFSQTVSSAMREIGTGVNEVATAANHVRDISIKIAAQAETLSAETGKFKT